MQFPTEFINDSCTLMAGFLKYGLFIVCAHYLLTSHNFLTCRSSVFYLSCWFSDIGIGQSQDDSIVGLRQTKHIPTALPVSGTLSSSNPDLLQSHHRILDFSATPGKHGPRCFCFLVFFSPDITVMLCVSLLAWHGLYQMLKVRIKCKFQTAGTGSFLFFRPI